MTILIKERSTRILSIGGCNNCVNGWVIRERPAKTFRVDGNLVYQGDDEAVVEYVTACPNCRGDQYRYQRNRKKADVPAAYYDAEFKDFDWTIYEDESGKKIVLEQQQIFVTSFINDYRKWEKAGIGLYIWSKMKGSGKTFLASAICNTLIKRYHIKPKFVSASKLLDIDSNKEKGTDPIGELCDCDLLVLDDLGQKNTGEDWMNDVVFKIFDARMNNKLVTIVTSNKKMEAQPFDDRISDRMFKVLQPIPLPNYCVRAKEAKEAKKKLLKDLGLMGGNR